ncbi:imidazole glycerol phosphate synthase subunit HisH [Dokdonella sp.]|uniref:imidazole glycerol phosphate synthase subunit HisH n=1 Tax=Dokdonella sp. TaxID=2291710 RepID=UPI001B1F0CBA|nr:imidazole glycerol phosphate synthase subunit HisH [Dokdonella sp.]MBO9663177.1 imidazole glycerol phosphate synthase subunit HisH [Dokdonella sp.]
MKTRAVIVPSGGANYGSLVEACRRIGVDAPVSADPTRILDATHVILPGVGAASHAMRTLREQRLDRVLPLLRQPLLGICLGMQLLFERSEEGDRPTMRSAFERSTASLPRTQEARRPSPGTWPSGPAGMRESSMDARFRGHDDGTVRVEAPPVDAVACLGLLRGAVRRLPAAPSWPHMGWNTLHNRVEHPLLDGIGDRDWFYFVHGYAAPAGEDTLAVSDHGERFAAVVAHGNVFGAQFHPEKSAAAGRRLLANFFALT